MANRVGFREHVRAEITPWARQGEGLLAYVKGSLEYAYGQRATENRKEIYERLVRQINSDSDDSLLIECCQAYGTIVYGIGLSSDLAVSMYNTFAKIERGEFEIKYKDEQNTKVNVFSELWASIIKNAYNLDGAALKLKNIKTFTFRAVPILSLGEYLFSETNEYNQDKEIVGKVKFIFKHSTTIVEVLNSVQLAAKVSYEKQISSLELRNVIRIAVICARVTLSRIIDEGKTLERMTKTDMANLIFGFFEEAFKKFMQKAASDKDFGEKHSGSPLNTNTANNTNATANTNASTNTNTTNNTNAGINTSDSISTGDKTNASAATI